MKLRDGVLNILESARGERVSGEYLAEQLGVSRQAVAKAVRKLKEEGYPISSSPHKGYLLAQDCDVISPGVIAARTGARVLFRRETASTNALAAEGFLQGGECIAVALSQTAGRGKDGEFPSPENGGIYASFAFPAEIGLDGLDGFREKCASFTEEVIYECSGKRAERMRIDEFYFGGKKCAGILTEFMLNAAAGRTEFAVVGIGIYTGEAFSSAVAPVPSAESRNRMIVSLWQKLYEFRKTL